MEPIRVAWGGATGPTAVASFDAALAEANCHNYNLVTLSSVVPREATVERVGALPNLGAAGDALHVVLGRATVPPGATRPAVAGVGWLRSESGRGLFYEGSGSDRETVRRTIERGLECGADIREWAFERDPDPEVALASQSPAPSAHATAVVVAAFGSSESLLAEGDTQRG